MLSRRTWVITGVVAAAVGATAIGAHAYRGSHHGGEYGFEGRHGMRHGGREWRGRWGRELSKSDYDSRTRERFARWDANSDGVVDATEAEAMVLRRMEKRRRHWRAGRRMKRAMQRFDLDRDGKVTTNEVETGVAEIFARIDLNGDDRITDADLPPMLRDRDIISGEGRIGRRWRRGRGMRMLRRLRGVDANKDNVITPDEMRAAAGKRFARFDRNKDGVIDQADRDAMKKEMVDYGVRRLIHRFGGTDTGKVTFDQFKAHRDKRFARMDIDGDGTISRDEQPRRGWARHGREHHGWRRGRDEGEARRYRQREEPPRRRGEREL